jgi:site-specific recombinase XerD
MSLLTQRKVIQQFIKTTNKWINRIAKNVGITKNITTYVARHTFSYIMLNNGTSIELVSNSPGHSDIKTTHNYASSGFNNELKKKFSEILTSF